MTEALNRDDIVGLLESLGSDRDEEVLAAAREVHARIVAAGADWDNLLVADETDGDGDPDADAADHPEAAEPPAQTTGNNAETLALIDKLLARPGISDDFRDELNGYKTDIAEGEFEEADHRYVRALHKRLTPKGRR
jgi:hypothetical protein